MRFVIGLISFYAILFSAPRWGWEGVITVGVIAVLADWLWRDDQRHKAEEREKEAKKRRAKVDSEKLAAFLESGSNFYGSKQRVWEFAHRHDLERTLKIQGFDDLRDEQMCVLATRDGFVLAFNRNGWPKSCSEWEARAVLEIISDGRVPTCVRNIEHFAVTDFAMQYDVRVRNEYLDAVRQKISQRSADFKARTASDMGFEATAIYVITTSARNSSKVGISDNPTRRKADLQTGNAQHLSVHAQFWMMDRQHALFLERRCHKNLRESGHVKIGEWFSVEPEIATRYIIETYNELIENRVIVEGRDSVSDDSTDEELRCQLVNFARWRYSKKGNFASVIFGHKMTVFRRKGQWHWVCDGTFSKLGYEEAEVAQREVLSFIRPTRAQMLNLFLGQDSG